jgi:hypothetical protein
MITENSIMFIKVTEMIEHSTIHLVLKKQMNLITVIGTKLIIYQSAIRKLYNQGIEKQEHNIII